MRPHEVDIESKQSNDVAYAAGTEVLRLAIDGLSNIDISEKLCISRETVKSHRKNILSKVGVSKVNDLKHMLFKTTAVQEIIF